MRSAQNEDRLARIERRLAEMRRRTMSTLTVTSSVDNQAYVVIRNDDVWLLDKNDTLYLTNARPPRWGYDNPWQIHCMFLTNQDPPPGADVEVMTDSSVAVFRPNHAKITVTTSTKVQGDPDGIAEAQAVYQVDGGAPVLIPASVFSTTSHSAVLNTWSYSWPADYWDNVIRLRFQTRIQPGAIGFHRAAHGPVRLYGAAS
jgi:hypothetical protein